MKTNTVFHFLVHWPVIFGGQSNRLLVSYMRTRIKVSSSKEQTSLEKKCSYHRQRKVSRS